MDRDLNKLDGLSRLEAEALKRDAEALAMPIRYVLFLDMLGFSDLVKAHPASLTVELEEGDTSLVTGTSKSAEMFGKFHFLLDWLIEHHLDDARPERMMIFSDCAFMVFENPLSPALCASRAMREFLRHRIPTRMAIAKGTCHVERFAVDHMRTLYITRSVFYGSGIVRAVEGEKWSGSGCRVFLHDSIDAQDRQIISEKVLILDIAEPKVDRHGNIHSRWELNWISAERFERTEIRNLNTEALAGIEKMEASLPPDARDDVKEHYAVTRRRVDDMRAQTYQARYG